MSNLYKITFRMDGRGVIYDPYEPVHLDSLIAFFAAIRYAPGEPPGRTDYIDPEDEMGLSLSKTTINGTEIFRASALFPEGESYSDLRHIRKRFRFNRAELCSPQIINTSSGFFKSDNIPHNLLLCKRLVGWFCGSRRKVKKEIRSIKSIGGGRRFGFGKVLSFEIVPTDEDRCVEWEGKAMRYYPHPDGIKTVRPRPPYWNVTGRVPCLLPGEEIPKT